MEKKGNICVFGASSRNIDQAYVDSAYELGQLMAQRGWACLNGAGSEGLMRAVSDGALDAGGVLWAKEAAIVSRGSSRRDQIDQRRASLAGG